MSDSIAAAPAPPASKNDLQLDGEKAGQLSENSVSAKQTAELPVAGRLQSAPMLAQRSANKNKKAESMKDSAQEKLADTTAETIGVGGKTFKRTNNVWYDSAYRGQTTTNVARGTQDYKKLDAGLRGIAANLGGTIVVVWREKAYRIQ